MDPNVIQTTIDNKPLFDPTYLNIEYVFEKIVHYAQPVTDAVFNVNTWATIGFVSSMLSVIFIAIIIFSLVRMREIQIHEKHEIDHEIHEALEKDKALEREENTRWHYILTLVESPNESDWRVSIIEADTMLEELLKDAGYVGDTLSELLEQAKNGGLVTVQNAWDGHLIRNQIAHQGSNFPLSQVEARRVIKMYQNVFEELRAI